MNSEQNLTREEAIAILNTPDEQLNELIERAGALRKKYKGNHVSIHLLTNARSGNCSQNCAYCAQSCRSHADIEKYKWVDDEKLYGDNTFVHDHKLSRHCIGLSGMKFSDDEIEELASKIRKMKEEGTHLCCSIGFLTKKQALMLKEAGLDRINHNLNTSRSNYPNICTTHTYEQRVNNIHMLQDLGFEICSGGIIGMGESKEDVVDMLLDLKEINPEAYEHEYLGVPNGDGGNVFEYLEIRDITDEEISHMDRIFAGVDYGWYPDAFCYLRTYYDSAREKIYLIDELYVNKWSNSKTADWIKKKGYDDYTMICDSAEPKSVNDFRDAGLPARGAIKGPGSKIGRASCRERV